MMMIIDDDDHESVFFLFNMEASSLPFLSLRSLFTRHRRHRIRGRQLIYGENFSK